MTTTATTTCPPTETLRRYCLGQYSDADGDRIEKHLSKCAACEAALSELDDTNDSLVRHLPLTGNSDQQGESGWLQRLMAFPPDDSAPTAMNHDSVDESLTRNSFDAYELSGVLGQGGMGVVYAARHRQLGRPVAIKVVNPRLVAAKEAQRRFDREIQVLGTLNHPGIVSATDAGRIAGAAYLVMERIEGADLASIVRKQGPLSISEACEVARQIALALAAAHDAGAVHRDVKPSNVMLDQSGCVKLLDFGLAHLAESAGSHEETSLGRLLGTLDYMSPEQAGGEQVGPAADLYGLGATLYFLLAGRPPKVADRSQNLIRQLKALTEDAAPRLNDVRSDMPAELNDLVAALLDCDPEKRPAGAAQVATELKTWAENASDSLSRLASSLKLQKPQMTDDAEVARSLSSLLGPDASQRTMAAAPDRGGHHRVGWFIATTLIAFAALIYFGIIVLIRTDQGTIRIESEVAGVTVELLDEDARIERLRIENQAGQTKVKAGKYRLRLTDDEDSVSIEPDVIVISKNETEVARVVTRNTANAMRGTETTKSATNLYEGHPESVWKRRFDAETNPVAMIEAGKALVALSVGQPPEQRISRLLRVGGELVLAGWGDSPDDFFNHYATTGGSSFSPKRWSTLSYPNLRDTWRQFLRLADDESEVIGLQRSAETIAATVTSPNIGEAMFATAMLGQLTSETSDMQSICDRVLTIPMQTKTLLHKHLVLYQADYYPNASDDARQRFTTIAVQVTETLIDGRGRPTDRKHLDDWLDEIVKNEIPIDQQLKGKVLLALLLDSPRTTLESRFEFDELDDGDLPYINRVLNSIQTEGKFSDVWTGVVIAYLDSNPRLDADLRAVLATLETQLRIRTAEDPWDMRRLIDLLQSRWASRTDEQSRQEMIPEIDEYREDDQFLKRTLAAVTNHDLLAYLVLAGGQLPTEPIMRDVPGDTPPLQALYDAFDVFNEADKTSREQEDAFKQRLRGIGNVLESHPVETIRILCRRAEETVSDPDLMDMLTLLTNRGNGYKSPPPIEPLLLLAIFSEIAGDDSATDSMIARTLIEDSDDFTDHLKDALETEFAIREVTQTSLRRLRGKTRNETLITEIDKLLPGAGRDRAEFIENNPDSLMAILQRYNDETRQERQEKFDPAIDDLSLEELISALKSAVKLHRSNGEHAIADALEETVELNRLAESLEFGGAMGASQRSESDGGVVFRQILPSLNIKTGPNSAKLVVLSQAELRWSRDGWSSTDWGEIHPPIDGTWTLHSVKADGADLDDAAFEQFCEQHPAWMNIRIANENKLILAAESSPQPFDLKLSYENLSRFQMFRNDEIAYQGLFMGNGFIDDTELRLTLHLSGGPPPKNYRTEGTDAVTLDYRRAEMSIDSKTSNHPQYPPSPEFPPVKISVFDEDGVPAAGAQVAMRLRNPANGAAEIDAEHVTGADGVAVDRILPYGKYYANVKTSDGWYMSIRDLPVEFGKGLRLRVIVPAPQHRATLELAPAADLHQVKGLKKLPMGDLRDYFTRRNLSFSPITTPEPSDDLGRFSTFPTLGNGVDQLAVAIRFDVHRTVPQPAVSPPEVDGEWIWLPDDLPKFRSYFLIDGQAYPKRSVNASHRRPAKEGKFFRDLGSAMHIGYIQYEFADPISLPTSIDIPAGLVTVHLTGIYGRATAEVARSLGIQPPSDDESRIWLSENVKTNSEWVQMIPGTKDWFYRRPDRTHHHHLLRVEKNLAAEETMVVALRPTTD